MPYQFGLPDPARNETIIRPSPNEPRLNGNIIIKFVACIKHIDNLAISYLLVIVGLAFTDLVPDFYEYDDEPLDETLIPYLVRDPQPILARDRESQLSEHEFWSMKERIIHVLSCSDYYLYDEDLRFVILESEERASTWVVKPNFLDSPLYDLYVSTMRNKLR